MTDRLTAECEGKLIIKAKEKDKQAIEQLIGVYSPLIRYLALKMHMSRYWTEELIQSGIVGMLQAVENFDVTKGNRFTTYAVPWILGEMKQMLKKASESRKKELSLDAFDEGNGYSGSVFYESGIDLERMDLLFAVRSLSDEERLLLQLRYFQDKTQKETSVYLNRSQSQVSKLERGILDLLRKRLCENA